MALRNSQSSFGSVARALHWGMALLVIAALALIELTELAPKGQRTAPRACGTGTARPGLVVLALVWFRLALAGCQSPNREIVPPPAAWQRRAAHAVEWTFYGLMIVLPLVSASR